MQNDPIDLKGHHQSGDRRAVISQPAKMTRDQATPVEQPYD
jgi:hypothetical protein